MNDYTNTLEQVFALSQVRGMNQSLASIKRLCEIYNHPERSFPSIHVAGTNGKGSVCTKIASVLEKSGYRCGLYTSPHISSFRERIRINGEMIPQEALSSLFIEIKEVLDKESIPATFFEIATLMAFLYFSREEVDVVILETGLGGALDATNVVTPLVSIITSIGLDHTEVLGSSLEAIASAKAGIMKPFVPVVIGSDVSFSFMQMKANELHCPLYQSHFKSDDYELENKATAKLSLSLLDAYFDLTVDALEKGLQTKPLCRFEVYERPKPVIFDVAHNPHGFNRLCEKIKETYPDYSVRAVAGFSKGKDIRACAELLEAMADTIHLVSSSHPRLASAQEVATYFTSSRIHIEHSVTEGLLHALNAQKDSKEIVLITGSFFIMCEARKALGIKDEEDPFIWYDPLRTFNTVS